jgi:tRNA dimethylallyltransferase
LEKHKTLIVIGGPTAVGKTSVAISLALALNTEIVSADSRQIYREMNIGTAKPSREELLKVKHHFIDTHSVTENYDAAQYGEDALKVIQHLFERFEYVVLCGGSGLYIKAVCEGFDEIPDVDESIRPLLMEQYEQNGIGWLQQEMITLDPHYFAAIDQNNPHRLIRALEVKIGTGKSISEFHRSTKREHDFNILKIALDLPREELYSRINKRMDEMIGAGLFEEAKALMPYRDKNALQTVGYQEIFDFYDGKIDYDETVRLLKRNSRRYAKRQLTWFKRDLDFRWFNPNKINDIIEFINSYNKVK